MEIFNWIESSWLALGAFCTTLTAIIVCWGQLKTFFQGGDASEDQQRPADLMRAAHAGVVGDRDTRIVRGDGFIAVARRVSNSVYEYHVEREERVLTYGDVLDLWDSCSQFTEFYLSLFSRSGFDSYIWETPPVSKETVQQPFRFIIQNIPEPQAADRDTFKAFFDPDNDNHGVVVFDNLGNDAKLVVPSPINEDAEYSGLAEFLRGGTPEQKREIWRVLSAQIKARLSHHPVWVSVAAGGVSWLHIRIDDAPKYYRYDEYSGMV